MSRRFGLCKSEDYSGKVPRDMAQLGSAPRSGRGGRRFESCYPDQELHSPNRVNRLGEFFYFQGRSGRARRRLGADSGAMHIHTDFSVEPTVWGGSSYPFASIADHPGPQMHIHTDFPPEPTVPAGSSYGFVIHQAGTSPIMHIHTDFPLKPTVPARSSYGFVIHHPKTHQNQQMNVFSSTFHHDFILALHH